MRATTKEQGFYSQIFKLVLPIVIQNLLSAAVNSADVVMLNYVGQSAISAVSLASNYANVLFMVYYGLGTGATLLCAQYFGKGNMRAIQTVEGIALRFSVIISVVVAGIAFTMPQMMMRLFTDNAELIRIGASYLRVMGVTYLCWGITEIYLAVLRSLGRVTISMAMNMMAFALNVFFNACFIFGLFGFPKLGATGVAIATAMSRVIELIGCVIVSIMSKDIKLDLRYMFIRNKLLFSDFVKLSLPALGNDLSWGVAFSMYSVILGHLGSDAVAACVVFKMGKPSKQEYRKYNIKTVVGPDDYASMKEVVRRRYGRAIEERSPLPDLIITDGGKGQMEVVRSVVEDELGLSIPIAGLAKDGKHRTSELLFGFPPVTVGMRLDSPLFHLLTRIQDEVHRFAITFHKDKRSKTQTKSELDTIKGIGEKTKVLLLRHFKSVKRIKEASFEELKSVIGEAKAKALQEGLDGKRTESEQK